LIGVFGVYKLAISIAFDLPYGINLLWTLFIVLGVCLYKGNDIALAWARISCVVGYVAILMLVFVGLTFPHSLKVIINGTSYFPNDTPLWSALIVGLLLLLIVSVHRQLYQPAIERFVAGKRNPYTQARLERINKRQKRN